MSGETTSSSLDRVDEQAPQRQGRRGPPLQSRTALVIVRHVTRRGQRCDRHRSIQKNRAISQMSRSDEGENGPGTNDRETLLRKERELGLPAQQIFSIFFNQLYQV